MRFLSGHFTATFLGSMLPKRVSDKCSFCMEYHLINNHLHHFHDKMCRGAHQHSTDEDDEKEQELTDPEEVTVPDPHNDAQTGPFAEKYKVLEDSELQAIRRRIDRLTDSKSIDETEARIWRHRVDSYGDFVLHRQTVKKTQDRFDEQLANLGDHELLFRVRPIYLFPDSLRED